MHIIPPLLVVSTTFVMIIAMMREYNLRGQHLHPRDGLHDGGVGLPRESRLISVNAVVTIAILPVRHKQGVIGR